MGMEWKEEEKEVEEEEGERFVVVTDTIDGGIHGAGNNVREREREGEGGGNERG